MDEIKAIQSNDPLLDGKIRPNIRRLIPQTSEIRILPPQRLLSPSRLDVMAKYIYARHKMMGVDSSWARDLYLEHLRVFNGFCEPDGTGKRGAEQFLTHFDRLIDSVREKGFDAQRSLVPVGQNNILLDGAHRLAACLLNHTPVTCLMCDTPAWAYDYRFFKSYDHHVPGGLAEKWLRPLVMEYCRLNPHTFVVTVFPSAVGKETQIRGILDAHGEIVYAGTVSLKNQGPLLLIRQMYQGEPWLGSSEDGFRGARQKTRLCFPRQGTLRFYIVQSDAPEKMQAAKAAIRDLFNIDKHSVHINDTHEETLRLCGIFLHENSIHFLNHASPKAFQPFESYLGHYERWIATSGEDKDHFCVDGSGVMALYGIRAARDLDFLSFRTVEGTGHPDVSCHNAEAHHYPCSVDDIIFNPAHHFYYMGLKFVSLDLLRTMKMKRGENKDRADVAQIDRYMGKDTNMTGTIHQYETRGSGSPAIRINYVYAHTEATGYCVQKDRFSVVWSRTPVEGCDLYAFQDAFGYREISHGIKVLTMNEPAAVLPGQYSPAVWDHFDHVLTSSDALAESKGKFIKMFHPAFHAPISANHIKEINAEYWKRLEEKQNAVCMINGNKRSHVAGELYSMRVKVARWFHENAEIPFHVYGRPAFHQLPNYKGEITPYEKKFDVLSRYRYALCFENIYHPVWSKGYLTEKLLHCLMCGTIPIYFGCYNVENYVPASCFIDFRQFENMAALNQFLEEMSDSAYEKYRERMRAWVDGGHLEKYSIHHLYDQLARIADPEVSREALADRPWRPVPIPEDLMDRPLITTPIKWSWRALSQGEPVQPIAAASLKARRPQQVSRHEVRKAKNDVVGIIFSKDRALQLDGTLKSFFLHCADSDRIDLKVLYTISGPLHERLYRELKKDFSSVQFVREEDFSSDVSGLLTGYPHVLFFVDDNIFVRRFHLMQAVEALDVQADVLGCTLRLGKNTQFKLHPERSRLAMPAFREIDGTLLKYDWTTLAPEGFGYPCELQSALYRVSDLLPIMKRHAFTNPNTLEYLLDTKKAILKKRGRTHQLCYAQSVCFTNPVNLVQTAWKNWSGNQDTYSADALAKKFEAGYRMDVKAYDGMRPAASHQLVNLLLKKTTATNAPAPAKAQASGNPRPVWQEGRWPIRRIPNSHGMIEVNGVKGFLGDGDMALLAERVRKVPHQGVVVEVGSFMGLSAIIMAHGLKQAGNETARIHCIDPWDSQYLHKLGIESDRSLHQLFLSNIESAGITEYIRPLRQRSIDAATAFADGSVDLLFIDGDHAYESCYADLAAWYPKMKAGATILGHDCRPGSGVYQALCRFTEEQNITFSLLTPPEANFVFEISVTGVEGKIDATASGVHTVEDGGPAKNDDQLTSILIINYNGEAVIDDCLQSLKAHTPEPHEVIVVDNASTDGSRDYLRSLDHITLIENKENRGCPPARAQAMALARGEIIVFLDNDTIVTPGWLEMILDHFRSDPAIGLVGPRSNFVSGPQRVKAAPYRTIPELNHFSRQIRRNNPARRSQSHRLVGFCLAVRRAVIDKIGSVDPRFGKFGFEDDDYTWRAAIAGFKAVIAHDVFIHHKGGPQVHGDPEYNRGLLKAWEIFKKKWGLPKDLTYGERYDVEAVLSQPFDAAKHVVLLASQTPTVSPPPESPVVMHEPKKGDPVALLLKISNALALKGNVDHAVDLIRYGIEKYPGEKQLRYEAAGILIEARQYEEALGFLEEMPAHPAKLRQLELTAYCMEGLERLAEAEQLADTALEIAPDSAPILNLKGILAYKGDDPPTAETYFLKAVASQADYAPAYTNLGLLKLSASDASEAITLIKKGFTLSPTINFIAETLHEIMSEIGDLPGAETLFAQACERHPHVKRLNYLYIDILIQQRNFDAAMEKIQFALEHFGAEDGIIAPALEIRKRIGPRRIREADANPFTISLCMIVRNEARHLARCLGSVSRIVDEIIVVDTGSDDRTVDVATIFGAEVYSYQWTDDFSEARNFSLSKAKGQWILILDADETVSPADHARLGALLRNGNEPPCAFAFDTRNYVRDVGVEGWQANDGQYPEEAGTGWFPSTKVRLFPNNPRIRFENAVHEKVESSLKWLGIRIAPAAVPVHHYGKLDTENADRKNRRYDEMGSRKLDENAADMDALVENAIQAGEVGDFNRAVSLWQRVLALNPGYAKAHFNLGYAYIQLESYEKARRFSAEAMRIDPELKEAALNLSICELRAGDPNESIRLLEAFLKQHPDHPMAVGNLGVAYCICGRMEEGTDCLNRVAAMGFDSREFIAHHAEKLAAAGKDQWARTLMTVAALGGQADDYARASRSSG